MCYKRAIFPLIILIRQGYRPGQSGKGATVPQERVKPRHRVRCQGLFKVRELLEQDGH